MIATAIPLSRKWLIIVKARHTTTTLPYPPPLRNYPDLAPSSVLDDVLKNIDASFGDDDTCTAQQGMDRCAPKSLAVDVFGWEPNARFKFIPLVDMWLDIDNHISADTIPSPVELWKEQEQIGR